MNLKPVMERLVVKRIDAETATPGGIIIPDNVKERPVVGEVVAVGMPRPMKTDEGSLMYRPAKVGDKVLFNRFAGTEYKEFLILEFSDVLAVVED